MRKRGSKKKLKLKNKKPSSHGYYGGFSFRRHRSKTDWAGVGPGDAFKANLDYYVRLPAQRLAYRLFSLAQRAAAGLAEGQVSGDHTARVQPQLGPCYSSYPSSLSIYAAVGLTAYLEFESRVTEHSLTAWLKEYLDNPAECDLVAADPATYKKMAMQVVGKVQNRLIIEDLSRHKALAPVELYRLFTASQNDLRFRTVLEILDAVILYGDVFPPWQTMQLHPVTQTLFRELEKTCRPYFDLLPGTESRDLTKLGEKWVRAVCQALAPYMPLPSEDEESQAEGTPFLRNPGSKLRFNKKKNSEEPKDVDQIPPMDKPMPPRLFDEPDLIEQAQAALAATNDVLKQAGNPPREKARKDQLTDVINTVQKAGSQQSEWEDMRGDIVEENLRQNAFAKGPIEGNPAEGHEVSLRLGGEEMTGGEIFDRPVELSDDLAAFEKLSNEAMPITRALRRALYPNVEQVAETERLCTGGSLDPSRLALSSFSEVIFKRYRINEVADRRGRPVLLIACDGSGSLNRNEMGMTKVLATAWLQATAKSDVQVLAGLYHSGTIRQGVSGPLVQWIYHPHKTPAVSRMDAARAVVSLPGTGTGVQSDALSLAFMVEEARRVARGKMVYLILISDCAWNRCFKTSMSGQEEVFHYIQEAYQESGDRLHTTLVAVGVDKETGFEELMDKVIKVSQEQLSDYAKVARQITSYVASCFKERKCLLERGREGAQT